MEDELDPVGLLLILAGVLLWWIAGKQHRGTLRRNRLVGIRTSETLASDAAWHEAHRATAGLMAIAGCASALGGIAVLVLQSTEEETGKLAVLTAGVVLLPILAAGLKGHRIAQQVNASEGNEQG